MQKRKMLITVICILLIVSTIIILFNYNKKKLSNVIYKDVNNIMVVAHPDDETLWGASYLLKGDYLVVCLTCGTNKIRVKEFKELMNKTNNQYIMLNYPDKVMGKRSDWGKVKNKISHDLEKILKKKKWNTIITHNPLGEYGHIQHKMTSKIVTSLIKKDNIPNLYYFGKYYSKDNVINNTSSKISKNDFNKKNKLLKIYKSQKNTVKAFSHMNYYEDLEKYEVS